MKAKDLKKKGVSVTINGEQYDVLLNFNSFEALDSEYEDMQEALNIVATNGKGKIRIVKTLLYGAIKNQFKKKTGKNLILEDFGDMIDFNEMMEIITLMPEMLNGSMPEKEGNEEDEEEKN